MQRAIDAFTAKIKSGTAALFYFNGFGIQAARQTYLIPVGAQIWTEADVRRDGISIDAVLAEMHRKGAQVKIVILDASRRNPFERRFRPSPAGLARDRGAGRHLAMYSAAPGRVINEGTGRTQPVCRRIDQGAARPNRTAEEVFNQTRDRRVARLEQRAGTVGGLVPGRGLLFRRSGRRSDARPDTGSCARTPAPAPPPPRTRSRAPVPQPHSDAGAGSRRPRRRRARHAARIQTGRRVSGLPGLRRSGRGRGRLVRDGLDVRNSRTRSIA